MKKTAIIIFLMGSIVAYSQVETQSPEYENEILRNSMQLKILPNLQDLGTGEAPPPIDYENIEEPPPPADPNLKRLIFFVHGLGGNTESWERAALAVENPAEQGYNFFARKCKSFRPAYNNMYNTLAAAAVDIRNEITTQSLLYNGPINGSPMPGFTDDRSRNFIIAHSQGGVITRQLIYEDLSSQQTGMFGYGGAVFVASSLQGAEILNNKDQIVDFTQEACEKLLLGPVTEYLSFDNFPLDYLFSGLISNIAKSVVNSTCVASSSIIPELFSELNSPITQEYEVGSAKIDLLNTSVNLSGYNNMPKVVFYGTEPQSNLVWRTFNWFIKSPNSVGPWDANDDHELLLTKVIPLYQHYRGKSLANKQRAELIPHYVTNSPTWMNFIFGDISAKKNTLMANYMAWEQGINWFDNSNLAWESIIGAREIIINSTKYLCNCSVLSYIPVADPNQCDNLCGKPNVPVTGPIYSYVMQYNTSDGVVLANSAKNLPGATRDPLRLNGKKLPNGTWSGSSHMQIRNDDALRHHLTELLDGNYGDYFFTANQ